MSVSVFSFSELRLVLRQLKRARGFALTAILTLALGVGVNVVAFGVLDAMFLRKLPVPTPDQLSFVQRPQAGDVTLTFPQYRDLRERNQTFSEMGAYNISPVGIMLDGQMQQRWATLATGSYFDLLHIRPALGRFPTAADDAHGVNASPFVVLTYDTWKHEFDGDPGVIGHKILLSKNPFTVIGVAPPGFYGTERIIQPALWADLWNAPQLVGEGMIDSRTSNWIWVIGRRKPGIAVATATADLNRIAHDLVREHPKTDESDGFALAEPGYIGNFFGPALHAFLYGVMLLAALVLAAACANLSGLYAARAADRRRDIAIRIAVGATHGRVIAELLAESILLGLVGGTLGCALARVALHALTNYRAPYAFPIAVVVEPRAAVYGFALLLSIAAGVLCAILPAREARRTEPGEVIKTGAMGTHNGIRRWTVRDALLVVEVALCCVLVTASAVSLRGLLQSRHVDLGFDPHGVILVSYNLDVAGYKGDATFQFNRRFADGTAHIPGVESVAFGDNTPLDIVGNNYARIYRADTPDLRPANRLFTAQTFVMSPNYLQTARIALRQGRDFTWADDAKAPRVAIVNEQFAKRLFGHRTALGELFKDGSGKPVRIVGVAEQGKYASLNEEPAPVIFYPIAQGANILTKLLIRLSPAALNDTPRIANAVTALIHAQDPAVPISSVGSWQAALSPVLFPARAATLALGVLGGLALVLAVTGIFGLASYTVARRMREFGIRVALGADRRAVLRAALGRIARVVVFGSVAGLAAGLASTRLLAAIVYGARASDPWVLWSVAATMACVGFAATLGPARRALRVEPALLLREE